MLHPRPPQKRIPEEQYLNTHCPGQASDSGRFLDPPTQHPDSRNALQRPRLFAASRGRRVKRPGTQTTSVTVLQGLTSIPLTQTRDFSGASPSPNPASPQPQGHVLPPPLSLRSPATSDTAPIPHDPKPAPQQAPPKGITKPLAQHSKPRMWTRNRPADGHWPCMGPTWVPPLAPNMVPEPCWDPSAQSQEEVTGTIRCDPK